MLRTMRFLRRLNPVPGIKDFWSEFSRPNPHRWPILGVSMLMTFGLLFLFTQERVIGLPAEPEVIYISTFEEGRSDEEILASNRANQEQQDALRQAREEREERRRELYRALGQATGLDTEEMEREIAEERAREEAEEARQRAELLGRETETGTGDTSAE